MDDFGWRQETLRRGPQPLRRGPQPSPSGEGLPEWLAALDAPPRAEEFELAFDSDMSEMLRVRILGPSRRPYRPRRSRR
jgi:hypothetical protein